MKLDGFVSELFFCRKIMRTEAREEVVEETTRRARVWRINRNRYDFYDRMCV